MPKPCWTDGWLRLEISVRLPPFALYPHSHSGLIIAIGWIAFSIAIATALLPLRVDAGRKWISPVLAGTPFVLGLIAYLISVFAPISTADLATALVLTEPDTPGTVGGSSARPHLAPRSPSGSHSPFCSCGS